MSATKHSMTEQSTPSTKKVKREPTNVKELKMLAQNCLLEINVARTSKLPDAEFNEQVLGSWTGALNTALANIELCHTWTGLSVDRLALKLKGSGDIRIDILNDAFAKFAKALRPFIKSLPAPSDFGRASQWPKAQEDSPILCLRPTEAAGLPLCTLHDVFREFMSDISTASLDTTLAGTTARTAAAKLCSTMGDSFPTESMRSLAFDNAIDGLLRGWEPQCPLAPDTDIHSCFVDRVLKEESVILVLREDKEGFGTSGSDVYMQIARDYDIYSKVLKESGEKSASNFLSHGAPTFLVCIIGPLLFIAGAFYDGLKPIIEPLGNPVFMLPDVTGRRQQDIAILLLALFKGIQKTKRLLKQPSSQFSPSTPRVYTSCQLFRQQTSEKLSHFSLLVDDKPRMFTALMHSDTQSPRLVIFKMLQERYGKEVHDHLAAKGLAPALYGATQLAATPTAYIMEYLQSPGWTTLHDLLKKSPSMTAAPKTALRSALDEILKALAEAGFVHGDLRPNNIMAYVDRDSGTLSIRNNQATIKVVDFDWAGEAGRVYYPVFRNARITEGRWPGVPGGPIEAGHDQELVASWLSLLN